MQIFDVVIAFGAILAVCMFLVQKFHLPSSLAPLATLSLTMLWFSVAGIFGVLVPLGYLYYALALTAGAVAIWDLWRKKSSFSCFVSPGFLFFLGTSLVFLIYLAVRQPVVAVWDEMSFWGTAAKITKLDNTLYTVSPLSQIWEWTATQKPGMIALGYWIQFFGKGFAAWKLYLAYDLLLFACFSAVIGALETKNWKLWIPTAIAGFVSPWFFTIYQRETTLRPVYMDSYGDIPAGVLAAGAVAFWFALRQNNQKGVWFVPVILTSALYVKDNTMPIAMMAFGIIALDCLLFGLPQEDSQKKAKVWAKRTGVVASCIGAMGAGYLLWSHHAAIAVQMRAEQGGMGTTSMSLGAVLKNGFQMLLAPNTVSPQITEKYQPKFDQVSQDMVHAFLKVSITMAGPCLTALLFITLLFVAVAIFSPKEQRLRMALLGGSVVVGFFAYYLVILFSYVFIFKDFQAASLDSYNRYIYPYLLFAFLVALAFLANASVGRIKGEPLTAVALGVSVLMLVRFSSLMMPQFTILDYPEPYFDQLKESEQNAQRVIDAVEPDARIFYVRQGDNGEYWFRQSYNLLPLITDPSGSLDEQKGWSGGMGGTFGLAELANGDIYYHPYTPEQLSSYLLEKECDYVYVEQSDEIFQQSYHHMFEDGLQNAEDQPALYQIEEKQGQAYMTPVEMEEKK